MFVRVAKILLMTIGLLLAFLLRYSLRRMLHVNRKERRKIAKKSRIVSEALKDVRGRETVEKMLVMLEQYRALRTRKNLLLEKLTRSETIKYYRLRFTVYVLSLLSRVFHKKW